jgi:hypothetical protein
VVGGHPVGPGSRFRLKTDPEDRTWIVTGFDPPRTMVVEAEPVAGRSSGLYIAWLRADVHLRPEGSSTQVAWRLSLTAPLAWTLNRRVIPAVRRGLSVSLSQSLTAPPAESAPSAGELVSGQREGLLPRSSK